MKKRKDNMTSMTDALKHMMIEAGVYETFMGKRAEELMNEKLGGVLAKYVNGIRYLDGTLYVSLNSAALRQELSYGTDSIMESINKELGEMVVTRLVLQ